MTERLDPFKTTPEAMKPMLNLEAYIRDCGLEHSLLHLVRIRASQINGCAYCLHMHTNEGRADGETEERMHLVAAWPESPLFTARERAALRWTEALTLLAQTQAPDDDYDQLLRYFSEDEAVKLTLLIGAINVWNRLAVGFRREHPITAAGGAQTAA